MNRRHRIEGPGDEFAGTGKAVRTGRARSGWLGMALAGLPLLSYAADEGESGLSVTALKRLSLEELANIEVTSVAKRAEPLSATPAAVHVLTGEDVARSGATTMADSLRWVPGLDVARVDTHNWAVGSRGFNEVFSNKLLVLIDGRSVYTPLYSGVLWEYQDVLLEDLERIEVIRGPGATVWGANAVNGVINVSTKRAAETQGMLVSAGGGNFEPGLFSARYGGRISDTTAYRVYGKHSTRENFPLSDGSDAHDRWSHAQGGFRLDWDPSVESSLTFQGDVYRGASDQAVDHATLTPPLYFDRVEGRTDGVGGNVLGRWTRQLGPDSEVKVQAYYDVHQMEAAYYDFDIQVFDVDAQHRFALGSWNEVVWGAGYRSMADEMGGGFKLSLDPASRTADLASLFVQDEIKVVEDRLSVFLGTKAEHNDYTGFEVQPGARVSWTPAEKHTVWASVARAVRTPSRAEDDVITHGPTIPPAVAGFPPGVISALGTDSFRAEELVAYELGYRVRPLASLSIDLAGFYNDYDSLRTLEPGDPQLGTLPGYVTLPVRAGNLLKGRTLGAEASVSWQVLGGWRLRAGYSFLNMDLTTEPGTRDASALAPEGSSPAHQLFLISQWDFPHRVTVDAMFRYVDRLESLGVPAYAAVDLRLAWRFRDNWEVSVVGQNLCDPRHPEFMGSQLNGSVASEVPRSVLAKLTWRY